MSPKQIKFFKTPQAFREWLEKNHASETELWVGYYKKATKMESITWPQSVEQALCFGWIDGIRKRIDDKSYVIRFTPRRSGSIWSAVNIEMVERLKKEGLMQPAGLTAFDKKQVKKSKVYAYEQKNAKLKKEYLDKLKENLKAFDYFQQLSPYNKKTSIWYVMSAKRETTQIKRLNILIDSCKEGKLIPSLRR